MTAAPQTGRALPPVVLLLAPFALGYFCSYFFRNVNAVAGPLLASEFALGASELGLLTSIYFLTFAAAQIPIGIGLDRFGPSRVDAVLLAFIAAGAALFGLAAELASLGFGRALIGAGAAGMLMSCMSAVHMWAPKDRIATYLGFATAAGGLGAIFAATPTQIAIDAIGWRNVFLIGAAFAALVGVLAFATQPWSQPKAAGQSLAGLLRGVARIYASRRFWQVGVASVQVLGVFLIFQSLWTATWLRDLAGYDKTAASGVLVALNVGMIVGFFSAGWIADAFARRGYPHIVTVKGVIATALLAQVWILLAPAFLPHLAWALYSFGANSLLIAYPLVAREFPPEFTGRVNTSLNLIAFGIAFCMQWAFGAVLDLFPAVEGRYAPAGYYTAWLVLLAAQALSFLYLHRSTRAAASIAASATSSDSR